MKTCKQIALATTFLMALFCVATPSLAAVSVRAGVGYLSATASGNSTVTEPASCASGDMEVSLAVADSGTSLSAPSGWTVDFGPTTQGAMMFVVAHVARGGSAPNLTWSVTGTGKYREVHILCLTGSAAVTFDSKSVSGTTGNAASHLPNPPSTTAVAATSLAIAGGINYAGFQTYGASTGYTIRTDTTVGNDNVMESKSLVASGGEDPAAFGGTLTSASAMDYWDGFTMTFTDAGGSTACVPTLTLLGVASRCG